MRHSLGAPFASTLAIDVVKPFLELPEHDLVVRINRATPDSLIAVPEIGNFGQRL